MTNDQQDRCIFLLTELVKRHLFGLEPGDAPAPTEVELVELDRLLATTDDE